MVVFVRPHAQDPRPVGDDALLHGGEEGIEDRVRALRQQNVAAHRRVALGLQVPARVLGRREADIVAAATRDETPDLEVLVRLGPPVRVADRIPW
ncbi:MAG: hypothetical protein E6H91_12105 [Chloroflexi bacterium]|nr:MAG: hypothetical protein E6H91_12105 [Chloroflexota bacterium]